MVERPQAIPGPLGELKDLVYELYLMAGTPSLDEIAGQARQDEEFQGAPGRDTVQRIIGGPGLPASQADLAAVVTVLARAARVDANYPVTRARELWVKARMARPVGIPLEDAQDPFDLEVHRPVEVEGTTGLPPYVLRGHDAELAGLVHDAEADGASRLVVLVGDSSTGKTRACWEALEPLKRAGGWRLWHPIAPSRTEALLQNLAQVGPRTVIWLNEAQEYIGGTDGERVAAGLREMLRDPARGPVLILATLWRRYWDELTRRSGDISDVHAQARDLLSGRDITVPAAFSADEIQALRAAGDARLTAAAATSDGRVTQFLAGAPELLARYRNAPPAARGLIDAAVDARRLGAGEEIPLAFLEQAVPGYLSDAEWEQEAAADDWLEKALTYTEEPCKGARGPLTRIRLRPGTGPAPAGSSGATYRLADYLDQYGGQARSDVMLPMSFWDAAANCAASFSGVGSLAAAALDRELLLYASVFNKSAALLGETGAAAGLVMLLHRLHPGDDAPAQWAASHAELTNPTAVAGLLDALRIAGKDSQVRALAARNPAMHASLDDPFAVGNLLGVLRHVGEDEQAELLGDRAVAHVHFQDPGIVAALLSALLNAGEDEQASALVALNPAAHTAVDNPLYVAALLEVLQEAGAGDQEEVLARRAAALSSLEDPGDVAFLLDALISAGAQEQVAVLLARDPAAHVLLDDPSSVAVLLESLRTAGAEDQLAVLLSRDPARSVSLSDPVAVARLLHALRTMGEDDQVAALVSRNPVAHVSYDDSFAVGMLLDRLREVGADQRAEVLADRAATAIPLDNPSNVATLLGTLRRVGVDDATAVLLARNPAAHVRLDNSEGVQSLLRELRQGGQDEQASALAGRLSAAGLFRLLGTSDSTDQHRFGREPDGSPAGAWGWDDVVV